MTELQNWFFYSPRRIITGAGCLSQLAPEVSRLGGKRVMIVTDPGVRDAGLVDRVVQQLARMPYKIFCDVKPNPTVENVASGVRALEGTINSPCIVAVGGGSVMDAAKMIAAIAVNGGEASDYDGVNLIPRRMLPFVAVNTTAGTGSDVTRWAVISDPKRQVKMAIGDENIIPDVAIDDPELTVGMPRSITAGTGMDALTHALEAAVGKNSTPMTDALAFGASNLILRYLPVAFADGKDLVARDKMMYAQVMAGLAFENAGVGNVHAMAHQLGAVYDLPHGLSNAVLLPYVVEFNLKTSASKYAQLARTLGVAEAGDPDERASLLLARAVMKLNRSMDIPLTVAEWGARKEDSDILLEKTMNDGAMTTNPRSTSVEEMRELWARAFSGDLECLTVTA